jgi:hypothetical protein
LDAAKVHTLGGTLRHRASDTKTAHHRASELTFLCLGPSLIDRSTSDIAIARYYYTHIILSRAYHIIFYIMPITRKRKATSPDSGKQSTIGSQKTINTFGRVTKSQKVDQNAKKRKTSDIVTIIITHETYDRRDHDITERAGGSSEDDTIKEAVKR